MIVVNAFEFYQMYKIFIDVNVVVDVKTGVNVLGANENDQQLICDIVKYV